MAETPVTRATLLVRIRDAQDQDAWQQFLELYGPVVYRWFRNRGLQDADATDQTQEVLYAVAAGAEKFEYDPTRGTFRSWLFKIARFKLHDYMQRQNRQPADHGDSTFQEVMDAQVAPQDELQWEQDYQRHLFILAGEQVKKSVDTSTWQAFWKTAVEGLTGQAVADELKMSVGAVYVAKSRVLTRIREQVRKIEGAES